MSELRFRTLGHEVKVWIQYFFISLISAFCAYDYYITRLEGPPSDGIEINLFGLLRKMWASFLLPWLLVFLGFSALRLLLILFKNRSKKDSNPS